MSTPKATGASDVTKQELEIRNKAVVAYCDSSLDEIPRRLRMYTHDNACAENLVGTLLEVRDLALDLGRDQVRTWHKWLAKRYPDVAGPIRSVTTGARSIAERDGRPVDEVFAAEITAFIAWAKQDPTAEEIVARYKEIVEDLLRRRREGPLEMEEEAEIAEQQQMLWYRIDERQQEALDGWVRERMDAEAQQGAKR